VFLLLCWVKDDVTSNKQESYCVYNVTLWHIQEMYISLPIPTTQRECIHGVLISPSTVKLI